MMNNIYLGFDTSNYTTSSGAVSDEFYINERKLLEVLKGNRGLRQSDALFLHIKNMPCVYSALCEKTDIKNVCAVGVSTRPRSVEGSYMPVFLAGIMQAKAVSKTLNVPYFEFSHQDGHIMAGVYSSGLTLTEEPFISVHLSGGTTEILKTKYNGYNFDCEILGATKDISAGQVIDRVGVFGGLEFPSGAKMDKLSRESKKALKLPVSVCGSFFNFSGLETKAKEKLREYDLCDVSKAVFSAVSETLFKALTNCVEETKINKILIAGGVASNSLLRKTLTEIRDAKVYFASAELSSDNAVGIALCTQKAMERD